MEYYQEIISIIALALGISWASGIRLYAAMLMLGLLGAGGYVELPPGLDILADPLVIAAAGFMYAVEFFADKTPGVDTGWDSLHTFIRIPAGAVLAAGAVGEIGLAAQVAAAIVGGSVAAGTHATKMGSRVLINTSPEPFTNWTTSVAEDAAVIGGLWLALNHPVIFIALALLFMGLVIWLLPKLGRAILQVFRALRKRLAWQSHLTPSPTPEAVSKLPAPGGI
jgi:Domain of unknown function (DUF4126)